MKAFGRCFGFVEVVVLGCFDGCVAARCQCGAEGVVVVCGLFVCSAGLVGPVYEVPFTFELRQCGVCFRVIVSFPLLFYLRCVAGCGFLLPLRAS